MVLQKKDPRRVNVYLDGEFAFGIYTETAAWLQVGQILTDEKIKKLLDEDVKADIYNKALDFISYKPRTVFETKKKLYEAGFDDALIEEALEKLAASGLLDDSRFAEEWVEERQSLSPRSKRQIQFELHRKGIPDHLIQSAIKDVDDFQSAYETAEKRLYRYEDLPKLEFRRKMGNFLAGKGYSYDVISEVMQKLWESIHIT